MPSKKKKYNARFPAGRIKKIMQSDEEIGKVAQAVPVIITLELFVESLLTKTLRITNSRNAKTLSTSHMKQCIMSEQRFDFLRELVKNVPDISVAEEAANYNEEDGQSSPEDLYPDSDTPFDLSMPSTSGGGRNNNNMRSVPTSRPNGGQAHYHQQYKQQPQNGGNGAHNAGINENELRQRIRQRIGAGAGGVGGGGVCSTQSVIMHTASVTQSNSAIAPPPAAAQRMTTEGNYVQPLKLMRSESSPANTAQHMWHVAPNAGAPPQQHQQQQGQKRLRHQAQSLPCGNSNISSSSNNNGSCHSTPPKRQRSEQITQQTHHSQTAIPAPVFSYDLCNKPVVKIDYSNLPLTPAAATSTSEHFNTTAAAASIGTLPMSAPVTNASFNFSADAPIINIDLSNIVTNSIDGSNTSIGMGGNIGTAAPAVATISIGPLPADLVNASTTAASLGALKVPTPISKPTTSITPPSNQSTDSKMVCNVTTAESTSSSSSSSAASSSSCSPSSSSSSAAVVAAAAANSQQSGSKSIIATMTAPMKTITAAKFSTACKNSNSFLELDEDYDNI